jgi:hypothetical protein
MITTTNFTPWRENGWGDNLDDSEQRRWEAYARYYHLRDARERDRDSLPGPTIFVRKSLFDMGRLQRARRFVRQVNLDNLVAQKIGVVRGRAIAPKPDPEYRKFLKDWQQVQWAREDLAEEEYIRRGDWASGFREFSLEYAKDVPIRAILGGMQLFTPWRENEDPEDWDDYVRELKKETHKRPKGYAAWRPQKKTSRLIMQVKEVLEEYRDYLPLTARQIFYRLVGTKDYPKTEAAYKKLCEHLVRVGGRR